MKKIYIIITAVLLIAVIILSCCMISANRRIEAVKSECLSTIFGTLNDINSYLSATETEQFELLYGLFIQAYITIYTVEQLYGENIISFSNKQSGLNFIAKTFRGKYSVSLNDISIKSIMYDGVVSDNEREYINRLKAEIEAVISTMLDDDGINMRRDIKYDDIREYLADFLKKIDYSNPDSPIYLLSGETE